jgi:2-amino-4-hydroxy-6-hydroxymethyldihydropteridine diphosphokinase
VSRAYIGLGANLGDARATLQAACDALGRLPGTTVLARSAWYRSAPINAQGPAFINGVAALDTALAPLALLDALQAIEHEHGRQRPYRNAPRTLDLDLLLYDDLQLASERLTLPHPRLHQRAFALLPLAELAPEIQIPGQGPMRNLLERVAGQDVERLTR